MKRVVPKSIGIIFTIILLLSQNIFALEVTINGDQLISDVEPYISESNRTMVPVGVIAQSLGLSVEWQESTRQVILSDDKTNIIYTIDRNEVIVNGESFIIDSPPVIKDSRTFLPVSDLAKHLGINVRWHPDSQTAELTSTVMGINLSHIHYWSSMWMFKDVMKQSAPWWVQDENMTTWSLDETIPLRQDGYPLQVPHDGKIVHTVVLMHMLEDGPLYPEGQYTFRFKGQGRILISMGEKDTILSESDKDHIINVIPSHEGIHITILESSADNPIHDIQFMMPGFKTSTEEVFHPKFLELLSAFDTLRFMKSSYVEETNQFLWSERTQVNSQTQSNMATGGLSFEYIADLSNILHKDAWINVPHDSSDDYVRKLAEFYFSNLDENLRLYVEYSNEPWNPIFPVYEDSIEKGQTLGLGQGEEAGARYNVIRTLEMMNIFKDVYGDTYDQRVTWSISTWSARREIGDYILDQMDQSGYPDAFSIAPYFGGELANDVGDGIRYTDNQVFEGITLELNTLIKDQIIWAKTQADKRNMRLISYESGSHFVSLFYPEDDYLIEQMKRINSDPRMLDMYEIYYNLWDTYAKDLNVYFVFCEEANIYGDFGMIHHFDELDHPKWQHIQRNTRN